MAIEVYFPVVQRIPVIELSYRSLVPSDQRPKVNTSENAYHIFLSQWDENKIEMVEETKMLLLDRSNTCLGIYNLSVGGVSSCIVDPKIIFAAAILAKASGIILAHNHPSGNIMPSIADCFTTNKIQEGGKCLEISLLDHLVVSRRGYYSFADNQLLL